MNEPTATGEPTAPRRRRPPWRALALIGVVVGLFVAALTLDIADYLHRAEDWIRGLGVWGPLAFIVIYVVATTAMVPGTALTAVAGTLFGAVWGTLWVSVGATIGAGLCFLIARYFARGAVADWLRGKERFRRLDKMTETQGPLIVAITRLVPVFPFNLLNYGFGLTRVGFWPYLLLSWVCMLPGTVLYVVGFDAIATGLREGRVPWALVAVAGVIVLLLIGLTWYARGRLRSAETDAGIADPTPDGSETR